MTVSECCLIKLLPRILFEKYLNILALRMTWPGNRHCANCVGTLSFPRGICKARTNLRQRQSFRFFSIFTHEAPYQRAGGICCRPQPHCVSVSVTVSAAIGH